MPTFLPKYSSIRVNWNRSQFSCYHNVPRNVTRAGHRNPYMVYIRRRITSPVTVPSTRWESRSYGRFCTVRVRIGAVTADMVAEKCARIRTYGKCTARIRQEPVPVLAGPIFCTVDGRNLYGCNRIRVRWPALLVTKDS
ncbi:hypothetical protein PILCRDRAFT_560339 [Piloderma croceum F 1598]|uniref:Uncharacterized protein n=1 Tax=Piloderma croceum (strain F 1598) TaxID=765440 RepID=A0A0C3F499_PILCF|nr:hypothetical protein PILCRDRAFT_560339 [Piloderma croceum F 1598]